MIRPKTSKIELIQANLSFQYTIPKPSVCPLGKKLADIRVAAAGGMCCNPIETNLFQNYKMID